MLTSASAPTVRVMIGNVVRSAPAGTVTVAGTETATLFDESDTSSPPAGAAAVRPMMPVTAVPPITPVGVTERPNNAPAGVGAAGAVAFSNNELRELHAESRRPEPNTEQTTANRLRKRIPRGTAYQSTVRISTIQGHTPGDPTSAQFFTG